ncbi:MAG: metal ABC transporter ATP-binding protein [Gaiellaceae bacterium]
MRLAVEFEAVSFAYGSRPPTLRAVDLAVRPGEFVAIAGPNGGGKTTLLRLALGLERPTLGEVRLFGEPARACSRRERLGYLPQRPRLELAAPTTVREVVAAGRLGRAGLLGPLRAADRRYVEEAIERVGLGGQTSTPIARLSGGQLQRALLAKALAGEPELLVLDEPTTGVDSEAQDALAAFLDRVHRELGVTILYVSHEFGAVERFVERLVLIRGGVVFDGSPSALPEVWHDPSHAHA